MKREWTENQLNAITARGGPLIVSAAAGSGKTAVLVERCIRLLTDPDPNVRVDADRLLAVTYTRAAAAELRDRLAKAIDGLIRSTPDNAGLVRQKRLLSKANISTVDSFCSSLAREYHYLLDIDRNFRIGDDGELAVLRADAVRMTLDGMYEEGDKSFYAIVETFATAKDDSRLENNIIGLFNFVRSHPFPKRWMEEKLRYYTDFSDASDSVWGKIIGEYTAEALEFMASLYDRGLDAISMDEKLYQKLYPLYESDGAFLERLTEAVKNERWDEIVEALCSFVPGRFTPPRGYADDPFKNTAAAARKIFKKVVEELKTIYAQSEALCFYDIELLKDYTEQVFKAVELFSDNYSALKREKGIADYPDLEHWAIELLVDENTLEEKPLAAEIGGRFDYIMVDEYQDANETQDTIFKAISKNESNLFVVGDVKQSIYGFRHAMPELFLRRKNSSALYKKESTEYPAKIILEKNFRSEASVLSSINFVFRKLMSPSVGDIEYNDEEKLFPGPEAYYAAACSSPMEFDIIDRKSFSDDDALLTEAMFAADRIHRMIAEGYRVKDGEGFRPAQFGDFAVLIRNFKPVAPVFIETFSKLGLPVDSAGEAGFLSAREIMVMTNLLRVINNPSLDIEMLSTLMSPVFGFNEDDLARIRVGKPKGSLYSAVIIDAQKGNRKSKRFLSELSYYRGLSVTLPLSKLINTIYERSSYMDIMTAVDRTGMCRNNLRMLLEYAKSYEQNTRRGLGGFVGYLDRLDDNGSDLPAAGREKGSGEGGVKVMSIHSSKGLEFPICIIANLNHRFVSDTSKAVLLHPRYGYAQKRYDPVIGANYNTMPRKALAMEISRDEKSEELRILYVALTRAKQKLILTSNPRSGAAAYLAGISNKLAGERDITPYIVRSASSMSDWLAMCAMLHPDAEEFRGFAEMEVDFERETDFSLECNVVTDIFGKETDEDAEDADIEDKTGSDASVLEELRRNAGFVYPFEGLSVLPVKVAASALAHKQNTKAERYLDRPAFMSEEKLNSAEKGTALHEFMQFADFLSARGDIRAEIERLVSGGYITRVQADSIDIERAEEFINSPLIDRALKAEAVYKEYRFAVRIPASMVGEGLDERFADETVILQGAVDLAFVEDGGIVIVDYKTDRVKRPEELVERYKTQLELYRTAMAQCLGIPVKECIIYSIRHGKAIRL